ncbi:hypothetical protein N657DRAFT_689595 [Parathielavia appendiculata]|uniref:Uncharacterized protein n=1 Tax=Parathielavia appendiculata TaxID=2587402 RepID=A0AAN6U555_9PEZI|nr:hypothetical protein N657DRAFT_689595 [Parathielavia appendiculata]
MAPTKPTPTAQPSTPRANRQAVLTGRIDDVRSSSPNTPCNQRPKGFRNGGGSKYGRCPNCQIGRRERSRFNPLGLSPHKGRFRFVCSKRNGNPPCNYSEVLASDPADNPAAYSGVAQSIEVDNNEEEDDDDHSIISPSRARKNRTKANSRAAPSGTISKDFRNMDAGKDSSQQKLGCPQCMKGQLVQKCRDTFHFRETVLVCEKVWNGNEAGGGCGYSMNLGSKPIGGNDDADYHDGDDDVEITKVVETPDAAKKKDLKHGVTISGRKKKSMDDWIFEERERAMENPFAAAVMAGPPADKIKQKPKRKIVVDLTSDDELLGTSPVRRPKFSAGANHTMVGGAIGAHAPILIEDDDEPKAAAEFEDLGSDDELQLIQLADKAEDARDDLDEDDVLELIQMADKAVATMSSQ